MLLKIQRLFKHGQDQNGDLSAAIANSAFNWIGMEPILREANPANYSPALYADFTVNGFWAAQRAALFDNHMINADAPSCVAQGNMYFLCCLRLANHC